MANPYALDFNPLASAISDNQQLDLARNRLAMDQQRLGFEAERLGFERDQHPLRLQGLQLSNTSAQQGITREDKSLPLDLQAKKASIAGQGLQNQSTAQNIQGKQLELEKELAGRAATIGQMIEGEPDPNKQSLMLKKFYNADPRIKQHLSKYLPPEIIDDPVVASRYMRAVATGYQAPQTMKVGKDEALVGVSRDPNNPTAAPKIGQLFKNDGNDQFKDEHQLRQEIIGHPTVKQHNEVKGAYGRVLEGAKDDSSGAGDLAIVYGFMKMNDPTSVVREGEFATAEKTAGVPAWLVAQYNKVVSGQRLAPEQRKEFLNMATQFYGRSSDDVAKIQNQYADIARRNKLNPQNVVLDHGIAKPRIDPNASTGPRFNPPRGMQDVVNGRGVEKPAQERLPQQQPPQTQMPRLPAGPQGDAIYNSLPSGSQYVAPDGSTRTKR